MLVAGTVVMTVQRQFSMMYIYPFVGAGLAPALLTKPTAFRATARVARNAGDIVRDIFECDFVVAAQILARSTGSEVGAEQLHFPTLFLVTIQTP